MHSSFKEWSVDSLLLLNPEVECVFPDFSVPKDSVFDSLYSDAQALSEVTKNVLQEILTGFVQVTEKQLLDFLPGGIYGMAPSDEVRKQLKPCPLSNLVSEYAFGDLDYDQQRRRQCSMHHLSGPRVISTFLIDPTQVESKKSSQIQWPVPSINAEPVDVFLGEE